MRWLGDGDGGRRRRAVDGPRVLVVDDNADMRDYIASLLAERLRASRRRPTAPTRWSARGPSRPTS